MAEQTNSTPALPIAPQFATLVITRLTAIERSIEELAQTALEHAAAEDRRFTLIEQFVDPAMNLQGLLAQLLDMGRTHNRTFASMCEGLAKEMATTRTALTLAVSGADLGEVEIGGREN
jgi:membrane-bound ClpP family serine protease